MLPGTLGGSSGTVSPSGMSFGFAEKKLSWEVEDFSMVFCKPDNVGGYPPRRRALPGKEQRPAGSSSDTTTEIFSSTIKEKEAPEKHQKGRSILVLVSSQGGYVAGNYE